MKSKSKRVIPTAIAALGVATTVVASLAFTPARNNADVRPGSIVDAAAPAQVQLDMATLHAAALSKARDAKDSADAPYLMVTVFGPGAAKTSMQMPSADKHWSIRQDEAKGTASLTSLSLAPGDSVRVMFTLLEGEMVNKADESAAAEALAKLPLTPKSAVSAKTVSPAIAPLTTHGAGWLGSAAMLLTNEGGKTYWRALDCVATCTVSNAPSATAELAADAQKAVTGVVELSGNAATYHLALTAKRKS